MKRAPKPKRNGAPAVGSIVSMPVATLLRAADPDNPRSISDEAMQGLRASLARFGLVQPIVYNRRTRQVVGGHQRVAALAAEGVAEAPVYVGDWDAREQRALNLTLNNPGIAGEFTPLAIGQLEELRVSLPEFGALKLDELRVELESLAPPPEPEEDDVPEPPAVAVSRRGDLWLLGEHRLLCGDSTKREDVARVMAGERAQCLFTDPPYGVQHGRGVTKARQIGGDLTQAVIPLGFAVACEVLTDDAHLYVCGGSENVVMLLGLWDHHLGRQPRILVWVKDGFVLRHHGYHSGYELIFHGWKGAGGARWHGDRRQSDVWQVGRAKETEHSTEKPVELSARALRNSTVEGDLTVDPFLGSGSTLIAAEQLGRRCFAVEIEPRYVDVAVHRWANLTGHSARLALPNGEPGPAFRDVAAERGAKDARA